MSQVEPTDLLCRSRREELSPEEQRRLSESIERSLDVKLMSQILPELERESRVRPGDDLLLARITAAALGVPAKAPRKRRPLTMLLVAAAVLLMASLAAAWVGVTHSSRDTNGETSSVTWPWQGKRPARPRSMPSVKPMPSALARIEPSAPEPQVAREIPSSRPTPTPSGSIPQHASREPVQLPSSSASELFARANLLRRQGRNGDAAAVYQLLLDLYPSAREVGPTRLALAKYFQQKQPELALAQYRAVASTFGALRAEALWGISETATTLGARSQAEQALTNLIREFPDSPYAEVARARTAHGSP